MNDGVLTETKQTELKDKFRADLRDGTSLALVKFICDEYPSCKGDYRLLVWRVWRELGIKISFDTFNLIRRAYAPETITRRYRELATADPEFYPRPPTREKRGLREAAFREYYAEQAKDDKTSE